jgi:hypothetical protein
MALVHSYVEPYGGDFPFVSQCDPIVIKQLTNHFAQDFLARLDACETYVPTAEGLQMFSNGQGFYSAERSYWMYPISSSLAFGSDHETTTSHGSEPASPLESPPSIQSSVCTPHTVGTPPSTPQVTQPSDSQLTLSDDEVRSLVEQYIQSAAWFREHKHEPLVGGDGVPSCALQIAPKGESIYRCFVVLGKPKKNKPTFKCATCKYASDRLHRVIGHQRVKRNHKPFTCQDVGW